MLLSNVGTIRSVGRSYESDRNDGSSIHSIDNTPLLDECPYDSHTVALTRSPGFGFGFALSGGVDEPPIENGGDRAVYVSDVLRSGPADGRLRLFDRIVSVNGVSLAGVDNATAVAILRDAGAVATLVVRRRQTVAADVRNIPNCPPIKHVALTRKSKNQDFGLVLGVRLYIKGILPNSPAASSRAATRLQEGDIILKLNDMSTEDLTLNEARKLLEKAKDRLELTVLPLVSNPNSPSVGDASGDNSSNGNEGVQFDNNSVASWSLSSLNTRQVNGNGSSYSGQTLTLTGARSTNNGYGHNERNDSEGIAGLRKDVQQLGENSRIVSFCKEGSVGIRLVGGNRSGIYIADVQAGSVAAGAGLVSGDHILRVNDCDYCHLTREEAVMHLLQAGKVINMIVEHQPESMKSLLAATENGEGFGGNGGDSFYVRANFDYPAGANSEPGQLLFRHGDILHVTDTLYNGTIGCWFAARLSQNNMEVDRGIIPNLTRGEQMRLVQKRQLLTPPTSESGHNSAFGTLDRASAKLFGKRREPRRAKSLSRDYWENGKADEESSSASEKRPAYERVRLVEPGNEFRRPVVVYGPVGDLARHRLTTEFPAVFESPVGETQQNQATMSSSNMHASSNKVIRLRAIRQVMERGRHAVLDITPNSVDKLTDAGFHPIVIFIKTAVDQRQFVKDAQQRLGWHPTKSTKKLLSEASRLESSYGHLFSGVINMTPSDQWFVRLRQAVELCQNTAIWVPDGISDQNVRAAPADLNGVANNNNFTMPDVNGNQYVMPNSANDSMGDDDDEEDHAGGGRNGNGMWKQQHPFATIRHVRNNHRPSSQQKPLANAMNRENGNNNSNAGIDTPGSYATLPSRRALPPPPQPPPAVQSATTSNGPTPYARQSVGSATPASAATRTPSEYANFASIRSPVLTTASSIHRTTAVESNGNGNGCYDATVNGVASLAVSEAVHRTPDAVSSEHYRTLSNMTAMQAAAAVNGTPVNNGGSPATPGAPVNNNNNNSHEGERVYPSFYAESLSVDQRQTINTYGTLSRPRKTSRSSLMNGADFRSPIIEAKELEGGANAEDYASPNGQPIASLANNMGVSSAQSVNYAPLNIAQNGQGGQSLMKPAVQGMGMMSTEQSNGVNSPSSDRFNGHRLESPYQTPPSPASANRYASLHLMPRPYRRPPNAAFMLGGGDGSPSSENQYSGVNGNNLRPQLPAEMHHAQQLQVPTTPEMKPPDFKAPSGIPVPRQSNGNMNPQRNLWHNIERSPSDASAKPQQLRSLKDVVAPQLPPPAPPTASTDPLVLDTIRASVDYAGGVLESKATGVSLLIPRGALPPVVRQEVYFRVCSEPGAIAALQQQGNQRLTDEHNVTPVVMCGPPGLVFRRQVELRLPRAVRLRLSSVPAQPPACFGPVDMDQIMSVFIDHF